MQPRFYMTLVFAFLVGCSSQPRQVEASLPLVQPSTQPLGIQVPQQYSQDLEDGRKVDLIHPEYRIQMGPLYTSSLGHTCRELTFAKVNAVSMTAHGSEQGPSIRVACTNQQLTTIPASDELLERAWFLVPNIIQSSSSVQL
ncbi:hypothetical protein BCU68_09085 [Vibrio sp. 10N.286.49.B3]|uniref:hypothetical protein n=1 Tax=Vibrio sp. 10N.286.49.B3 TaxID=1880855 RepID=UPI000C82D0DD|nr:hypothetical protein [Vibrio sp. 10N.286.49.B3]PMH45939.1 hypothetical protein BCU68_09085 [Vibrio sp. 10N.286.49.B3]